MDNLTNLKLLWQTANTSGLPNPAEMLKIIRKFRNHRLRKKWLIIFCAGLITAQMVALMLIVPFNLVVTYIGGSLITASGLVLMLTNILSLRRFYRLDDCSNKEFLDFIEQTRLNQIFYYKKTQVLIMALCSLGLVLYLYEPATKHLFSTILLFTVTAAFLMFNWLVLRPRTFKSSQQKLDELRKRLEQISSQLN